MKKISKNSWDKWYKTLPGVKVRKKYEPKINPDYVEEKKPTTKGKKK